MDASARDSQPAADEKPATGARVLERGQEPRRDLRVRFDPKAIERGTCELTTRATRADGSLVAEERASARFEVRYPSELRVELRLLEARNSASPELERALAEARGSSWTLAYAERGTMTALEPAAHFADASSEEANDTLNSFVETFVPLFVTPLPAEPVGVGARWSTGDRKRIHDSVFDALRYEMKQLSAGGFSLEHEVEAKGQAPYATGPVEVDEKQAFRIDARDRGIARRVEGTMRARQPDGTVVVTALRFEIEPEDSGRGR